MHKVSISLFIVWLWLVTKEIEARLTSEMICFLEVHCLVFFWSNRQFLGRHWRYRAWTHSEWIEFNRQRFAFLYQLMGLKYTCMYNYTYSIYVHTHIYSIFIYVIYMWVMYITYIHIFDVYVTRIVVWCAVVILGLSEKNLNTYNNLIYKSVITLYYSWKRVKWHITAVANYFKHFTFTLLTHLPF